MDKTPVSGPVSFGANRPPLALHVPQPPARPGEAPDFSAQAIPEAGATPRPETDAHPAAMRDLAYGLINPRIRQAR